MSRALASVVVPAFNEGPHLADRLAVLTHYLAHEGGSYDYEIIVVDDGSSDETYDVAAAACAISEVRMRVVRHAVNRGLGCAIRTGFQSAEGSIAVIFDSDLSYAPEIIPQMLAQIDRNGDDLVLASPYMRGGSDPMYRLCAVCSAVKQTAFCRSQQMAGTRR